MEWIMEWIMGISIKIWASVYTVKNYNNDVSACLILIYRGICYAEWLIQLYLAINWVIQPICVELGCHK